MTDKEAMAMALDALETLMLERGSIYDKAIAALKERLADPMREVQRLGQEIEQEPVGMVKDLFTSTAWERLDVRGSTKVYLATPPQRKPLTDEEMKKIWYAMQNIMGWYSFQEIARAIEAAHGIKENQ